MIIYCLLIVYLLFTFCISPGTLRDILRDYCVIYDIMNTLVILRSPKAAQESLMDQYFVYILTNKGDKVLYTGITNNLLRRIYEHKHKLIDGFTKKYRLTKLVYFEGFSNVNDALANEKKIKGWLRVKKINLIKSKNPAWKDLSLSF